MGRAARENRQTDGGIRCLPSWPPLGGACVLDHLLMPFAGRPVVRAMSRPSSVYSSQPSSAWDCRGSPTGCRAAGGGGRSVGRTPVVRPGGGEFAAADHRFAQGGARLLERPFRVDVGPTRDPEHRGGSRSHHSRIARPAVACEADTPPTRASTRRQLLRSRSAAGAGQLLAEPDNADGAWRLRDDGRDAALRDPTRDRCSAGRHAACGVGDSRHPGRVSRRIRDRERRAVAGRAHHDCSGICSGACDPRARCTHGRAAVFACIRRRADRVRRRGDRRKAHRADVLRFGGSRGRRLDSSGTRDPRRTQASRDVAGWVRALASGCTERPPAAAEV
jgi:hypothetical protein